MKDKRRKYLFFLAAAAVSVAVFVYLSGNFDLVPYQFHNQGYLLKITKSLTLNRRETLSRRTSLRDRRETDAKNSMSTSPFNFTIHDTGLEFKVSTQGSTVQEALAELNMKLHPQDSITPPLETPLSPGLGIVIKRRVFKREVPVPFETLYVKDDDILYGGEVIRQYGETGLKEETYLLNADSTTILNVNQIPISSEEILEEKILKSPIPKIIAEGTKIVPTGFEEFGQASWCKPYSGWGYVAAHPILKRGSRVLVTNLENQRQVVVKIIDWGPDRSIFPERVIDLSPEAFRKLGVPLSKGVIKEVKIEEIE